MQGRTCTAAERRRPHRLPLQTLAGQPFPFPILTPFTLSSPQRSRLSTKQSRVRGAFFRPLVDWADQRDSPSLLARKSEGRQNIDHEVILTDRTSGLNSRRMCGISGFVGQVSCREIGRSRWTEGRQRGRGAGETASCGGPTPCIRRSTSALRRAGETTASFAVTSRCVLKLTAVVLSFCPLLSSTGS